MGATPEHGWPWPELTPDPADGPAAFGALLSAVEATWTDPTVTTYTPGWTSVGGTTANLAQRVGWYRREGSWCDVGIFLAFGPATNGGTGQLTVTLPFTAATLVEQVFLAKLWVPSLVMDFHGVGVVAAGSAAVVSRFATSPTDARVLPWQSASAGGAAGTGVPAAAGAFTVQNGGNYSLHGRYKVA
jgi:hypothetical protein